jgi:hypothetical protein
LIFLVQIHRFSSSHIILLYISGRSQRIKFNQNLTRKKKPANKMKTLIFQTYFYTLHVWENMCRDILYYYLIFIIQILLVSYLFHFINLSLIVITYKYSYPIISISKLKYYIFFLKKFNSLIASLTN